jgi:purine-binding chemotaxis protein CheW
MKRYFTFRLNGQLLGIEIQKVFSLCENLLITRVPLANRFIEGMIHYRGHIVSVIDLRKIFDILSPQKTEFNHLILRSRYGLISLLVDEFLEIEEVNRNFVRIEIPKISKGIEKHFISQAYDILDEESLLIINIEKILEFKSDRVS